MAAKLSPAQKKRLRDDGFVVVPGVVPSSLTGPAIRAINNRLGAGPEARKSDYANAKDYLSLHLEDAPILDLAKGGVRALAESLLGANKVEPLTQGQVVLRFPAANDAVQYERLIHIDGIRSGGVGLLSSEDRPLRYSLCAGVFLSDLPRPEMGNLVVYPGSHRLIARKVAEGGVDALKRGVAESVKLPPPAQVLGKTGDVVLFHFQTAHDKTRNLSPVIRRTAYFRFWHVDAWHDRSRAYLERAMKDPWLEWPGMRSGS